MKIEPVATAHANGRIERHVVLGYAAGPERLYNEAQLRQLGEACVSKIESCGTAYSIYYARIIRELVKEMLG